MRLEGRPYALQDKQYAHGRARPNPRIASTPVKRLSKFEGTLVQRISLVNRSNNLCRPGRY
jgi:hypothetical protein